MVLTVFIVGFAVAFLFPLYWMVTSGLKNTNEVIQSPPTLVPHSFVLSNFSAAWDDLDLARLIGNTTLYAAGALVFQLVFDMQPPTPCPSCDPYSATSCCSRC